MIGRSGNPAESGRHRPGTAMSPLLLDRRDGLQHPSGLPDPRLAHDDERSGGGGTRR